MSTCCIRIADSIRLNRKSSNAISNCTKVHVPVGLAVRSGWINATCLADLQKGESIAVFLAANRPANSVTFALEAGSTAKPLKESLKSH